MMSLLDVYAAILPDAVPRQRGPSEYAGPCPFCGGKDRFIMWPRKGDRVPGRFRCSRCWEGGDTLTLAMRCLDMTFREACDRTGIFLYGSRVVSSPRLRPAAKGTGPQPAGSGPTEHQDHAGRRGGENVR